MEHKAVFAALAAAVAIAFVVIRGSFSGIGDVAHEAVQFHLNLISTSIYEHHAATGKWPTKIDDLEKTSLPAQSPYWRSWLNNDAMVIVWQTNLKPDPKDNVGHILVYHNKGLIAEQGQSWVCWGDLRTEYIQTEELRGHLSKLKD